MPIWLAAIFIAAFTGIAIAGPKCTSEPKAKWMSEQAMKAKLEGQGFSFRAIKVTDGNCYEIYGRDKSGKRVEIYFNPVSGEPVEEHKS
jgi:hypothetical protein